MPVKPAPVWGSSLQTKIDDAYAQVDKGVPAALAIAQAYQTWIMDVATGIETAPPFVNSKGVNTGAALAPLKFPPKGSPAESANVFATAWFNWYLQIQWNPIPPMPPFSVISTIVSSPLGAATAKTAMLTALIAIFSQKPTNAAAGKAKYKQIAMEFWKATNLAGVQINGIAIAGAPPPPLIIPQHKAL